jgi:hypothetical protein
MNIAGVEIVVSDSVPDGMAILMDPEAVRKAIAEGLPFSSYVAVVKDDTP